jgi:hypothetical protein
VGGLTIQRLTDAEEDQVPPLVTTGGGAATTGAATATVGAAGVTPVEAATGCPDGDGVVPVDVRDTVRVRLMSHLATVPRTAFAHLHHRK